MKNAIVYIILVVILSLPDICFSQLFPARRSFYTRSNIRSCPIVQTTVNICQESSMANRDQTELGDYPLTLLYTLYPGEDHYIHYYTELYDREGLGLRLHSFLNQYESHISTPGPRREIGIKIIYGEKNTFFIVSLGISRRNIGDGDNDYYIHYSSNFHYETRYGSGNVSIGPTGLPKRRSDIAGDKDKAIEDVVNFIFTWIEQPDKRWPPLTPGEPQTLRNAKGEYYTP